MWNFRVGRILIVGAIDVGLERIRLTYKNIKIRSEGNRLPPVNGKKE